MRIVVKFGGTSIANGERIEQAADTVSELADEGHEVAVVASAMDDTTDVLLDELCADPSDTDHAEVVSMGERTSVRLFKSYLSSAGVNATFVEPGDDEWPILVHPDDGNAVAVERTRERTQQFAEQLDDCVPVVAGYLAEDEAGNVRTLGRGGSDTTATMLGNFMDADEVVLVTDVWGILTGDPDAVDEHRRLDDVPVSEVGELAVRGADVVAPAALDYKTEEMDLSVVHYEQDDVLSGGTDINGAFETITSVRDAPFAAVTVSGDTSKLETSTYEDIADTLSKAGVTVEDFVEDFNSVTFHVRRDALREATEEVHEFVKDCEHLSSVSTTDRIAVAHAVHVAPDEGDSVRQVAASLLDSTVEIHDMVVTPNSLTAYLAWDDRRHAEDILRRAIARDE